MAKKYTVCCPVCGGQLLFGVKCESYLTRKIKKDGALSKVLHLGPYNPTDIHFLECDNYNCNFIYNLSYPENNNTRYDNLDKWYEEYGCNMGDCITQKLE